MLGLGLSVTQLAARGLRLTDLAAAIRALFAAGEQGVWYDPSDLTTLYQDAAGTTPVTAIEQPVGLILDKSKGLVLGPELVTNGTFDTNINGWTLATNSGGTISWNAGKFRLVRFGATAAGSAISVVAGRTYRLTASASLVSGPTVAQLNIRAANDVASPNLVSVVIPSGQSASVYYLAASTGTVYVSLVGATNDGTVDFDNISVRELPGNHATQTTSTSRPVLSARVNLLTATETLATQTVTTRATTQTLRFEGAGTVTLSGTATGTYSAGSHSVTTTAGNLTLTVSGTVTKADLRAANMGVGLSAYQRVNTATDYDTVGFPHYLRFDGVDDWLVTPTITPGVDKAQVFAGVRKLSDAAGGFLVELSSTVANPGTFGVQAPNGANSNYEFGSGGSIPYAGAATATGYPAPITNILTGIGDISGDRATLRINGTQVAQSTADQGTGNYGNYPLYIGRRGGISLPFNGHLYSLIVRGAQSTDQQIIDAERYVNDKTRAY